LDVLVSIAAEFIGQGDRGHREGYPGRLGSDGFQCFLENGPFEGKTGGQYADVVKILHPAVHGPKLQHGVEFFGDGRFFPISPDPGSRQTEKSRENDGFRRRPDPIADSDVHLKRNPDISQMAGKISPDSLKIGLIADRFKSHGLHIEMQSVRLAFQAADIYERASDLIFREISDSQEIQIHGLSGNIGGPKHKKHGPFHDEFRGINGLPESVKPALKGISSQYGREIICPGRIEVQKALVDGSRDVRDLGFGQDRASIYGFMIF